MRIRVLYRSILSRTEVQGVYEFLSMSARVLTVRTDRGEKLDIYISQIIDARPVE